MPSLLWTGFQKVCLDQTCFILNTMWDFTSRVWELQLDSVSGAKLLSLNIRCVLLPGFVPGLGFLPCRVQKQVGTAACQAQPDRNCRKYDTQMHLYLCSTHQLLYCFAAGQKGLLAKLFFSGVLLSCLQTCPISPNCYGLKNTDSALGGLAWPGAVYRSDISICSCPYACKTLAINKEMSTKMCLSWNVF